MLKLPVAVRSSLTKILKSQQFLHVILYSDRILTCGLRQILFILTRLFELSFVQFFSNIATCKMAESSQHVKQKSIDVCGHNEYRARGGTPSILPSSNHVKRGGGGGGGLHASSKVENSKLVKSSKDILTRVAVEFNRLLLFQYSTVLSEEVR